MYRFIRPLFSVFVLLSLLTGLAYPACVTALAAGLFPAQAAGSLVMRNGQAVGSVLIGQVFTDPAHFWGRPSATSPMGANAAASSGSNLGPLNPALVEAVQQRVKALRDADPGNAMPVPVELVTASASGLDPHISPAAAWYQAARVARVRHLPLEQVRALVSRHVEGPWMGFLGEPVVNVLSLNLAIDTLKPEA
jgi:K+-transporting ATPase ATPase C chain